MSRSNLITRVNNLDLGDRTSQNYFRTLLLDIIELGDIGFGGDKFYVDPVNGNDSNDGLFFQVSPPSSLITVGSLHLFRVPFISL